MLQLLRTHSDNPFFTGLTAVLDKELAGLYPLQQHEYAPHNKMPGNATTVIALWNDVPVGCGCFKKIDDETIEIKRMFVDPEHRGKGIAGTILTELEKWAKELSFSKARLETGTKQEAAIHLYQKMGYHITENYGPYIGMETSICMFKILH